MISIRILWEAQPETPNQEPSQSYPTPRVYQNEWRRILRKGEVVKTQTSRIIGGTKNIMQKNDCGSGTIWKTMVS